MNIIPSIDLLSGQCVRLSQGDFSKATVYGQEPKDIAQSYYKNGARVLHVVDLTRAQSQSNTSCEQIREVRDVFSGVLQLGGGIRTDSDLDELFSMGIDRIVLGSIAVNDPTLTKTWLARYGTQRIVLALDFIIDTGCPYLAISGWQTKTQYCLWDIVTFYRDINHVLCTDISKDGMLDGPNIPFYEEFCARYPGIALQASGGVTTCDDICALASMNVSGAIIGKALYEKKLTLEEAIACLK